MLEFIKKIKNSFPWIWDIIEQMNSIMFFLRYKKKLNTISFSDKLGGYEVTPISSVSTCELVDFFAKQPVEAFKYFKPHGFDERSLSRLQRNKAFIAYVLKERQSGDIVGYCFNRCFFIGRGFRGRLVDINHRGKGLGVAMNKILNDVGFGLGIRLFETVSKDNIASYKSALSASNVRIVEELPNNELYLEILK